MTKRAEAVFRSWIALSLADQLQVATAVGHYLTTKGAEKAKLLKELLPVAGKPRRAREGRRGGG